MTRIRWWLACMVAGGTGLVACGRATTTIHQETTSESRSIQHPISQSEAEALRTWAGFPVDASPRPIVLVGHAVVGPSSGFSSGAAKLAYVKGAFVAPKHLPAGPTVAEGYPLIGAIEALGMLNSGGSKDPTSAGSLRITTVRLGAGTFSTDRGPRSLPAWLASFQDVQDPAAVLAIAPTRIFASPARSGTRAPTLESARLGPDGRTLTVRFTGYPPGAGPCTAGYTLATATSATAVALGVHEDLHGGAPASSVACALVGNQLYVTKVLSAPLGARVVVDAASDTAVAVTGPVPSLPSRQ